VLLESVLSFTALGGSNPPPSANPPRLLGGTSGPSAGNGSSYCTAAARVWVSLMRTATSMPDAAVITAMTTMAVSIE